VEQIIHDADSIERATSWEDGARALAPAGRPRYVHEELEHLADVLPEQAAGAEGGR